MTNEPTEEKDADEGQSWIEGLSDDEFEQFAVFGFTDKMLEEVQENLNMDNWYVFDHRFDEPAYDLRYAVLPSFREASQRRLKELVCQRDVDDKGAMKIESRDLSNFIEYIKEYAKDRIEDWPWYGFEILGLTCLSSLLDSKVVFVDKWRKRYYPGIFSLVVGNCATRTAMGILTVTDIMKDLEARINRTLAIIGDYTKEGIERFIHENGCEAIVLVDEGFDHYLDPENTFSYPGKNKEWLLGLDDKYDRVVLRRGEGEISYFESKHLSISFLSSIYPDRFFQLTSRNDVEGGFFGRFVYIILPPSTGKVIQGQVTRSQLDNESRIKAIGFEITKAVNDIDKDIPVPFAFNPEDDPYVTEWSDSLYEKCRRYEKDTTWALYNFAEKSVTLMKKISLMYEFLSLIGEGEKVLKRPDDDSGLPIYRIRKENIDKGIKLADQNFNNMVDQFSEMSGWEAGDYEKAFIKLFRRPALNPLRLSMGTIVKRSDLLNHLNIKAGEFNEILTKFTEEKKYYEYSIRNSKTNRSIKYIMDFRPPAKKKWADKLAEVVFRHFEMDEKKESKRGDKDD